MNINCIIVDDEPIARLGIEKYSRQIDGLTVTALCKNVAEAQKVLKENTIDLIFLDIEMPGTTGIDFLRTLDNPPLVVFITAYPNYAIDGYSLNVLDYLLKPVSFDRFKQAVAKAQENLRLKSESGQRKDFLFIKTDYKLEKVFYT
jgi:two-component SAPR family response regulator